MSEPTPERRRGDPEIASLREEVATLTQLTQDMNGEMTGLRGALNDVNELRRHQLDIEETARTAATRVETVEQNSRGRARRLNITVVAMIVAGIVFVISAAIASYFYVHAQHVDQARARRASYGSCVTRNTSAKATHALLESIINAEQQAVDTTTAQALIVQLRMAETQQKPVDCTTFLHS